MDKKVKILATLGPAIFKKNIINNLIHAGVAVVVARSATAQQIVVIFLVIIFFLL